MGEAKFKANRVLEAISQAVGVETSAGRIQVHWDTDAATTPFGQMVFSLNFST